MGKYNSTVITSTGQSMIASAIAGSELEITAVVTSSYAVPSGTDLASLTSLSDIQQTVAPSSMEIYNNNLLQITALFDNTGLTTSYDINALGIMASLDGAEAQLFAVSTAVTADTMPDEGTSVSSFIYQIQMTVSNASSINVTIATSGYATVAEVEALQAQIDKMNNVSSVTFTADGWTETETGTYTQTVTLSAATATDIPVIYPNTSSLTAETEEAYYEAYSLIKRVVTDSGSLTAYAYNDVPTIDVPIYVKGI